jgi:hypothetical protein
VPVQPLSEAGEPVLAVPAAFTPIRGLHTQCSAAAANVRDAAVADRLARATARPDALRAGSMKHDL